GYDGSGTVVGVISDGIDHAADAQATGDLPPVTVPADVRCRPGSGDEGTALLEIVHDLAPGVQLLFSEGATSSLVFIDSVNCLAAAGAGVIGDDLVFLAEPFFADGPLALAVRAAVQAGVSYHSAAGNEAEEHVEQPFRASPDSSFHDFLGGPVDNTDDIVVPPGVTMVCFLQWNDPFGGSANDYDLGIFDSALNLVAASTGVQDGTQDPFEVAGVVNNSGSAQVAKVAIEKFSGADRVLEMFCLDGVQQQYVTDGSVIAQAARRGGAVDIGPAGFDDAAGAGRLDALAAAALVCTADAQCDDANACTVDACDRGACTHSPLPCDDGDACTVDTCDPAAGCRATDLPGLDYVSCALDHHLAPLPPPAAAPGRAAKAAHKPAAHRGRAERLVAHARGARPARARRLLKRARKVVTAMGRLAGRRAS